MRQATAALGVYQAPSHLLTQTAVSMTHDQHRNANDNANSREAIEVGQRPSAGGLWQAAALILRSLASLYLAVPLIFLLAVVLAWATFLESKYDEAVSQFGIYSTGWFRALGALLAINVAAAMVVRFPWRRRHIGFLLTHTGILVLLAGFWTSQRWGISARLGIFEGQTADTIEVLHRDYFELAVMPRSDEAQKRTSAVPHGTGALDDQTDWPAQFAEPIRVPFVGGPFNWEDYQRLAWFPWRLAYRSSGVLYQRDGIRLEVLDYCSHSRRQSVPGVTVRLTVLADDQRARHEPWSETLTLSVRGGGPHAAIRPTGVGQSAQTQLGPRVSFWMSGSADETEAFLKALPDGQLGPFGQVVFYFAGQVFRFPLEQFQRKSRQSLADTGLEVELMAFDTESQAIRFAVHRGQEKPEAIILYPNTPELNKHDLRRGLYGAYWVDVAAAHAALEGRDAPAEDDPRWWRIDIIQGHDRRLYYRTWLPPKVEIAAAWPGQETSDPLHSPMAVSPGSKILAFSQIVVELEEFLLSEAPGWIVRPVPFVKSKFRREVPQRRVLVRLTVDETSEEFWLAAEQFLIPLPDDRHTVRSGTREVTVALKPQTVKLGFAVHLRQFRQRLEPGSRKAESFESYVDFLRLPESGRSAARAGPPEPQPSEAEAARPLEPIVENACISMNAPVDVTDPVTGRCYRFFQEGRWGPVRPGWREYEELVGRFGQRERFWLSWLAVSYDPGRGLKYAGSLLIVVGIAVVYYFRGHLARNKLLTSSTSG